MFVITLLLSFTFTPNIYSQWYSEETVIIDVRTPGEFNDGHLKRAINIPYKQIAEDIPLYVEDKDRPIMVYCRSGRRSGIAKKTLEKNGYTNVVNGGGFRELKPLEP